MMINTYTFICTLKVLFCVALTGLHISNHLYTQGLHPGLVSTPMGLPSPLQGDTVVLMPYHHKTPPHRNKTPCATTKHPHRNKTPCKGVVSPERGDTSPGCKPWGNTYKKYPSPERATHSKSTFSS